MISYPAKIKYDKLDKVYHVEFPDIESCITYGESLEYAKEMAKEALTGMLESFHERKIKIPEPSKTTGKNIYMIEPEAPVAFAIWLKIQREKNHLSQSDVAKELGIKYQTYQRIENPLKTNPTLKTILKLEKIFKKKVIMI